MYKVQIAAVVDRRSVRNPVFIGATTIRGPLVYCVLMSRENDLKEHPSENISPHRSRVVRQLELALIPLALIGALLFVIVGADRSLWLDEASSLLIAAPDWHGIVERLLETNNLPAYYLILHQWTAFLGDSELVSRSLSGLFYLATIGLLFLIGRFFPETTAPASAAFFYLISTQAIQQAQNLRMYSLLGFLASLSLFFYLRWISSATPKFADSAGLVLSNVLGSFTHMWYFFSHRRPIPGRRILRAPQDSQSGNS